MDNFEAKFKTMSYTYPYPKASVTVDIVIFCKSMQHTKVLLIQRGNEPFRNLWALPGGFIEMDETLEESAVRELHEETGLQEVRLHQFKTYGDPGRDPRGRTISIVFYGFTDISNSLVAGADDAKNAGWFARDEIPDMAFDHNKVLDELMGFLNI
jgi:8-oxo-dGTP diphosphatase